MMENICVYSFNNLNFLEPLISKVQMMKWMFIPKKFGNESIANVLYFGMMQKYDF
jgi:hypothetical protein